MTMLGDNRLAFLVVGLLIALAILVLVGITVFIVQRQAWRRFAISRLHDSDFRKKHPLLQLADPQRLLDNIKLDSTVKNHSDLAVLKVAWLPYLRLAFAKILAEQHVETVYPLAHYDIAIRDVSDEQLLTANTLSALLDLTNPILARLEPHIRAYEMAFNQYAAEQELTPTQRQQVLSFFSSHVDYHEQLNPQQLEQTFPIIFTYLFKKDQLATLTTTNGTIPRWLANYLQDHLN